ncbi:hypothetical protein ACGF5F_09900 [Streptomyces sp. NPDC047821]|uniref:hypothetical protein n=1 Tax=Streptomyces sp. NPDC047821 TaxID=3365488 RepID=UPI003714D1E5
MPRIRSRRLTACALTAVSVVLATTALTSAAGAAPKPAPKDSVKVLDWLAVQQNSSKPEHPRVGTDWTSHGHLYTHKKGRLGKKIGDISSHCSIADRNRHGYVALCHRVLRTDHGSISLSDAIDRSGRHPHGGRSAVTGGTGAYADAEGQAEITFFGKGRARFLIKLDD